MLQCKDIHWGRVTHICVSKSTIIGSDNSLSPGWHRAIIWTNDGILLTQTQKTNFSKILSEIHIPSLKKMHLKMSSARLQPFCLSLNVFTTCLSYHEYGILLHACKTFQWIKVLFIQKLTVYWPQKKEDRGLFVLQSQCCGCCWPGDISGPFY